jgi:hypothetical protein
MSSDPSCRPSIKSPNGARRPKITKLYVDEPFVRHDGKVATISYLVTTKRRGNANFAIP